MRVRNHLVLGAVGALFLCSALYAMTGGRGISQQGTFLQSGTGAQLKTIETELRETMKASQFTGADACAQIAAAIAALPSSGGFVDASMLSGAQTCASNPFSGVAKPVELRLGMATYWISAQWAITASGVTINGAARDGVFGFGTIFKWTGALGGGPMVKFVSANANYGTIEDISFDGNALANVCLQFEILAGQSLKHPHMQRLEFYNYRTRGLVIGEDDIVTLKNGQAEQVTAFDLTWRGGALNTAIGLVHNAQNDEHFNCFNCYFDPFAGTYQDHQYAIYNKGGAINFYGLSTTRSDTASIFAADTVNVYSWRSEDNFLLDTASNQFIAPMLMESVLHNNMGTPSVTQGGTPGSTTWIYQVNCLNGATVVATTLPGSTTSGAATLTGVNFNTITWQAPVTGTCTSYDVFRTIAGGTPATGGKIGNTASLTLNDTGLAADGCGTGCFTTMTAMKIKAVNTPVTINTATLTGDVQLGATDPIAFAAHAIWFAAGSITYLAPQNQTNVETDAFSARIKLKGGQFGGTPTIQMQDQSSNTGTLGWNGTGFTMNKPLLFTADNAQDIGASGATRPRNIFLGTDLTVGQNKGIKTTNTVSALGYLIQLDASNNVVLGSAISNGTTLPAGNTFQAGAGILPGTPAGATQTGQLFMGSGVPSNTNGNNGDFYFRTDTPGTPNQRLYIKSAGSWVALTL